MKTINIIGCGKVGKTLGKLLVLNQVAVVKGILNTSYQSSVEAATFVGQGTPLHAIHELAPADIYLITTQDNHIQSVCGQLVEQKKLASNSIIIHCSGLSSDLLLAAKGDQRLIASVHPVKSFANPNLAITTFKNTLCAFEGDENAAPIITDLFESIGARIFKISRPEKSRYHAALVMANNYIVTLYDQAMRNLSAAGVDESIAKQLVTSMMTDATTYLKTMEPQTALTGPIQRGDITTLKAHMVALDNDPISRAVYSALGIATLSLTQHSEEMKQKIRTIMAVNKSQ